MAKLVGPKKRTQDREKRRQRLEKVALRALKKHQPKLFHSTPDTDTFDQFWPEVLNELMTSYNSRLEFTVAIKFLIGYLHALAREHNLNIKLPIMPVSIKRSRPLRTLDWQKNSNAQIYAHELWLNELKTSQNTLNGNNLYSAIICSVIYHSGVCCPEEVLSFTNLFNSSKPFNKWDNLVYVEVKFRSTRFNTNVINEYGDKETLRRIYLSPFTLSLLNVARKRLQKGNIWTPPKTQKSCWRLIKKYMSQFGNIPSSFSLFCKSAIAVTEFGDGINIPEILLEYATGRNHSYSIPIENQRRIQTPNIRPIKSPYFKELIGAIPSPISKKQTKLKIRNEHGIYDRLLKATDSLNKFGHTRSEKDVKSALYEILDSGLKEHEFRLVHWLFHNCYHEVATVRRYLVAIGKEWLAFSADQELDELSSDDYWLWYSQLIEIAPSLDSKKFNAGRYQQFHQHCAYHFSAPPLDETLPFACDKDIRPHSRAGFIDETLFHAMLSSIENFSDLTEQDKLQYQCIAILCNRCGLRISEALKLLTDDIEISEIGWLTVRENKFGKNKSNAAYRHVPLYPMLVFHSASETLPDLSEYAKIQALLRQRRTRATGKNSLLFCKLGRESTPLYKSNVSRVFKFLLTNLSGQPHFVTHHFRHSCISRLQFLIHSNALSSSISSGKLKNILPYDIKKCEEILELISTKNKRDKYWALASFAGHSSPETTFNNYFHFSDLILGYLVNQRHDQYSQTELKNISGISRNKLYAINKDKKNLALSSINSTLISEINKWIKVPLKKQIYTAKAITIKKHKIDMDTCYQILRCYENGINIQELLFIYQVTKYDIEKWIKNAFYIQNLLTSKKNQRFNSIKRTHSLTPAKLNSLDEKHYVEHFYTQIYKLYQSNKSEVKWALSYFLNHHAVEHGVYFNKPDEFKRFVSSFKGAIPKLHWRLSTRALEHHENSSDWAIALNGYIQHKQLTSVNKGRTGHGSLYLKLANPNNPKHTSPILSRMLRMVVIRLLNLDSNTGNQKRYI